MSTETPDFSKVRMKVNPSLSSSAPYVQGINITENVWNERISPSAGRGFSKLYFSASYGVRNITGENFFDDSIFGSIRTLDSKFSGNSGFVLSNDLGKAYNVWTFDKVGGTFGITDLDPLPSEPFCDKDELDPVVFIQSPLNISWPVVLEDPAAVDPYDYNGLIEPIAIRGPVVGTSTFVGDDFDPEPTGFRAELAGAFVVEQYNREALVSDTFLRSSKEFNPPFGFVVDKRIFEGFAEYITHEYPYTTDDNSSIDPFVDEGINDKIFSKVRQHNIRNYLLNRITASADSRSNQNAEVTARGYEYEDSQFGMDSIAYGGFLR